MNIALLISLCALSIAIGRESFGSTFRALLRGAITILITVALFLLVRDHWAESRRQVAVIVDQINERAHLQWARIGKLSK
jgi:uncharacterized membrane protein (DUF373 family)